MLQPVWTTGDTPNLSCMLATGTFAVLMTFQRMIPILPDDSDVSEYMGHKLKISRAGEEFIGVVTGWADVDGTRPWMLVADNASMTFLPSGGWDIHDCTVEKAEP
jgi:hypothetical protein